jgi:putative transposase
VRRAYVFRLRPTPRQHVALAACVDAHRELYNAALQERRDAWSHASKIRISYGDQSAQLTEMRAARPDQAVWSFSSQQATLRRLNKAFAGFFRRVKAAKAGVKPGYPRFKGAGRFDSVQWPKNGDGARWLPEAKRVYLQGIGPGQGRRAPRGGGPGEDDPNQATRAALDAGAVLRRRPNYSVACDRPSSRHRRRHR